MTTILTACTSRKAHAADPTLMMRNVPSGTMSNVAEAWGARLKAATATCRAEELYRGRDYLRLRQAAGSRRIHILSAGLGLLHPDTMVPSYTATVAASAEDSVYARARGAFSPRDWFFEVQCRSPYAMRPCDLPREGLVLAALPARYLAMIGDDLAHFAQGRLRLFTGSGRDLPSALERYRMPYDGLLADVPGYNGPMVGFAERALCHFLKTVLDAAPAEDADHHATRVRAALRAAADALR